MNLSLQPTASSVILTVLVMAAGIWTSDIAWKRNRRPLTFKLEVLRLAILGFICFLLFQPEWLITSSPQENPAVSVLEDRSGSMETQDVEISPQHVVTRTAYVQELLKGNSTGTPQRHACSGIRLLRRATCAGLSGLCHGRHRPGQTAGGCHADPPTTSGRSSCSRTAATTPHPPC